MLARPAARQDTALADECRGCQRLAHRQVDWRHEQQLDIAPLRYPVAFSQRVQCVDFAAQRPPVIVVGEEVHLGIAAHPFDPAIVRRKQAEEVTGVIRLRLLPVEHLQCLPQIYRRRRMHIEPHLGRADDFDATRTLEDRAFLVAPEQRHLRALDRSRQTRQHLSPAVECMEITLAGFLERGGLGRLLNT